MREVVCPVVRQNEDILAFRHPLAGLQLVKGGIETGETATAAALRELAEESGIVGTKAEVLTVRSDIQLGERWHLVAVDTAELPRRWTHDSPDDGGHRFAFFWQGAEDRLIGFDPRFRRAIAVLQSIESRATA